MQNNGQDILHAIAGVIRIPERPAAFRAVAARYYEFRIRHSQIGFFQRRLHIFRDRPGHQKRVGVARRCEKIYAKALYVIQGVGSGYYLRLAGAAGAGIDFTDIKGLAEFPADQGF